MLQGKRLQHRTEERVCHPSQLSSWSRYKWQSSSFIPVHGDASLPASYPSLATSYNTTTMLSSDFAIAFLLLLTPPSVTADGGLGSSCENCAIVAGHILQCDCTKADQSVVSASIDLNKVCTPPIATSLLLPSSLPFPFFIFLVPGLNANSNLPSVPCQWQWITIRTHACSQRYACINLHQI